MRSATITSGFTDYANDGTFVRMYTLTPAALPTSERTPAWRAACLAYREQRRAGAGDLIAWRAAVVALQAVWPLSDREAGQEATNAIAYAASHHTKWFWSGVGGTSAGLNALQKGLRIAYEG